MTRLMAEVWRNLPSELITIYKEKSRLDKDRFDREILAETIANNGVQLEWVPYGNRKKVREWLLKIEEIEKANANNAQGEGQPGQA